MTLEELADSYSRSSLYEPGHELKVRTLFNWREKVNELFGLKIHYASGTYRLEHLEKLANNAAGRWLIQSLSVNESLRQSKDLGRRILLEDIPSSEHFLTTIINAMRSGHVLRMTYKRFHSTGEAKPFDVEPYCIKVSARRWYMLCRVLTDFAQAHVPSPYDIYGALKIYSLDRIQSLEETQRKFQFPNDFDPADFFGEHFGVCIAALSPVMTIRVKINQSLRDYIQTLPLHHTQQEIVREQDYSVFQYELRPTIDFRRTLLSYGADAEVLSPTAFRQEMADEAQRMTQLYQE